MNELLGKKLYFTKNNEIVFYQDHRWWSEIPHDVEFTITGVELDKYWLTGDGYVDLLPRLKPWDSNAYCTIGAST